MDEMAIPAPFSPKDIPANFDPNFEQNSTDQFGQSPVFEASVPQSVEQNSASRLEQNFAETLAGKSPAGFEPDLSGFDQVHREPEGSPLQPDLPVVTKSDDDSDDVTLGVTPTLMTTELLTGDEIIERAADFTWAT